MGYAKANKSSLFYCDSCENRYVMQFGYGAKCRCMASFLEMEDRNSKRYIDAYRSNLMRGTRIGVPDGAQPI